MDNLSRNWEQWHKFCQGKQVVRVELDEHTIFASTVTFKNHREYVAHLFKQKGYEIIRFGHEYGAHGTVEKWGLVFDRSDSEFRTMIFANGIVGENIAHIKGMV